MRTVAALVLGLFATAEAAQTTVAWAPSQDPDVVGYRVHYGTTSKQYDKTVDVGNTTTTTVANLTADASYYFVVTAYNSLKLESVPSSEVSKSTAVQKLQVVLAWDRSTDPSVSGYRVQYGTSSGKYDKKIDVGSTTTATVSDLAAESSYFFVVTAYTAGAQLESLPSNEVTVPSQSQTSALAQTSSDTSATLSGTNTTTLASTTSDPTRVALKAAVPGGTNAGATTDVAAETAATAEAGRSAVAGKYIGVILSSTPSSENAGEVTLNTTSAGKFTGTMTLGGKRHALKGVFDTAGAASVSVPRAGSAPLTVTLQASAGRSTGELSGTVSDGTTTSEIAGDRAVAKNAASTLAGKWIVLLSAPEASASEALPADPQAPEGTGHATIQVSRSGSARISGTLADGSVFAHGTSVSKNNYLYVYVPLYKNRGVLAGVFELKSDAQTGGTLTGSVQWVKPAGLAGKASSPEGFQLDLQATGESYRKPAASQPGAGFPSTNGVSTITLSGGDLAAPLSHTLSISAAGKVSVTDPGADRLKVTLNVAAGTFSGSFLDVGASKQRRFSGAVLQTQAVGAGAFQGGTENGSVTLLPKK